MYVIIKKTNKHVLFIFSTSVGIYSIIIYVFLTLVLESLYQKHFGC